MSAGRAYASNPPTYQQMQTLTLELEAERKQNAANVRLIRQYETKIKWQEFELRQAQRQIDKLKLEVSGLKKKVAGLFGRLSIHVDAYSDGLNPESSVYDGFRYGTVAERKRKSETVTKAVCTILSGAGGNLVRYTGNAKRRAFEVNASNGSGLVAERVAREAALQTKLQAKIKKNTNVVVCIAEEDGVYSWALAKALGRPRKAVAGEKDHDNQPLKSGSIVVDINQYEIFQKDFTEFDAYSNAQLAFEKDPQSVLYCIRTPMGRCEEAWCNCGSSVGCMKQHQQTYRLSQLREPAGFKMATPTVAAVRKQRRSNKKAPLAYMLSSGVLQSIMQNISALDVS
jgi:hypothetical protein